MESSGQDPGADLVHLEGCDVTITGHVISKGVGHSPTVGVCRDTVKPANSTGCIEVWAHGNLVITGELDTDLGGSGGSNEGISLDRPLRQEEHHHHRAAWAARTRCTPTATAAPAATVKRAASSP